MIRPMSVAVRIATSADVSALASAFARAYADDPLVAWFVPKKAGRVHRLERLFRVELGGFIRYRLREVLIDAERTGGAAWAAPGTCKLPTLKMIRELPGVVRAIGLTGSRRSARAYNFLQALHPIEPHWFLEGIATHPEAQRQGVATALMAPILERCDREGTAAYLETQNPGNVSFYERRGFLVSDEVDVPGGGPHMWLMKRAPGGLR